MCLSSLVADCGEAVAVHGGLGQVIEQGAQWEPLVLNRHPILNRWGDKSGLALLGLFAAPRHTRSSR